MRRLFILVLLMMLLLVSCRNVQDSLTLPSSLSGGSEDSQTAVPSSAPRVAVTPTPPLPPTFTPEIMAHQGHLYLLPVSGADGTVTYVHVVRPGDTLAGLSRLYGVMAEDVVRVNDIEDQNLIKVGQALVIPITFTP
ncbi:MAG: LysM peptidoglycan-binding domain-containing protein [Chloroflexi bacterium]|nr:LysM peptidoglycan-binding domain-containing protein [Chloroflexota bacterium]